MLMPELQQGQKKKGSADREVPGQLNQKSMGRRQRKINEQILRKLYHYSLYCLEMSKEKFSQFFLIKFYFNKLIGFAKQVNMELSKINRLQDSKWNYG